MLKRYVWLVLAVVVVLLACGEDKGTWLVKVKNQTLEQEPFIRRYKMAREYSQHPAITTELIKQFIDKNQLENLLFQAEAHALKLDQDSTIAAQLKQEKRRMLTRNGGPLFKAVVPASFTPTEEELQAAYEHGKKEYKVSHILVKSQSLADSIHQALQNGAGFTALVEKYTMDPNTREHGGQMPNFLNWMQMAPHFAEAVRNTPVGNFSKPTHTNYGYHIIRIDEVRDRWQPPYEEALKDIQSGVTTQKQSVFIENYINELPIKFNLKIDAALVEKLLPALQAGSGASRVDYTLIAADMLQKPIMAYDGGQWSVAETLEKINKTLRGNAYQLRRYEDVADFIYKVSVPDMMERDAIHRKLDQTDQFRKDFAYTRDQLLGQKARERLVTRAVKVEEADVRAFYEAHKVEYKNRPYEELQSTLRGRVSSLKNQEQQQAVIKELRDKYKPVWNQKMLLQVAETMNAEKAQAMNRAPQANQPPAQPQGVR